MMFGPGAVVIEFTSKPDTRVRSLVVLGVLGGTTWLSGGFWAPDGAYTKFVSPLLLLLWAVVVSRVLLTGSPPMRGAW